MSKREGSYSRSALRLQDRYGSREALDISLIEIIAMVILMVLGGVAMFGAVSQARASSQRSDPTEVASADLNLAAQQIQLQKFEPCTPANPEPYTFTSAALTPTASSTNLAIATNSLPIAQAPSAGISHPYFAKLGAINGVSGFSWSVSPNLPSGLSLSADGVISGVPQAESSAIYRFTVVSNGNSDSKDLSLTIVSVEVLVHNALLNWTTCQHKSAPTISSISANGSTVTYTYSSPTTFVKGDKVSITGVTPPSFNFNSAEVLRATSNQLVIAKSLVGTYRSGGSVTLAKSRNVQQIKLSTTVQGQRLTRTITVSN